MIRKLYYTIKRKIYGAPKWTKETEAPIEHAFTFDGEDYFMFANPLAIPWQRGFVAMSYYEEFNMRITRDFMESWLMSFEEKLSANRISLVDVVKHVGMLKDRMTWVVEPITLYKLASVVFFTRDENPMKYDFIYNQKKIKVWQSDKNMLDFFLHAPCKTLLPHLKLSEENISTYLSTAIRISKMQITEIQRDLSQSTLSEECVKRMNSELATMEELLLKL